MKVAEGRALFEKAYRNFIANPDVLKLLRLRGRTGLGRFSLLNCLLIMDQAQERDKEPPEMVATYKAWQKKGRQVVKGAKAYHVIKPVKKRVEDELEDGLIRVAWPIVGFDWLPEFDVRDTEGDELPDIDLHWRPKGEDPLDHFAILSAWATEQGLTIKVKDTGHAGGWYDEARKEIAVDEKLEPAGQVTTLVHELIHWQGITYKNFTREEAEVITETASAIVCLRLGLDKVVESINYVALWSKHEPTRAIALFAKAEDAARKLEAVLGEEVINGNGNGEEKAA